MVGRHSEYGPDKSTKPKATNTRSFPPLLRDLYNSRGGKAVRLTYDHKGSDAQEAKRITDAGGFVMNARVNGVLAVTRSLGDSAMKEFVVGSPYTTETVLGSEDSFLIIACDGVSTNRLDRSVTCAQADSLLSLLTSDTALGRDRGSRSRQPDPRRARPTSCLAEITGTCAQRVQHGPP